jgi:peptidoglycan-associated lipoprotein
VLLAACGKKSPETVPDPSPGPSSPPSSPGGTTTTGTPTTSRPATGGDDRAEVLRILQEPIYFEYNEDAIRSDAQPVLDRKAAVLLANPALRIRVAGHADERGSDEYNLVLGTRRAAAAKRFFETKGIDGSRVEVVSFGEERPVDAAGNESAWARNRRDEFEVVSGADRLVKPQ